MGLRDRLEKGLDAGLNKFSAPVDSFRGLHAIFSDNEQEQSVPTFILKLIRAVRMEDADDGEEETAREIYLQAKKRRRRLGLVSFTTGPLVPVATELVDLYCETAVVCDLDELHRLGLTEHQIGSHLLVLWGMTDNVEDASRAMADDTGAELGALVYAKLGLKQDTGPQTKMQLVKRMWEVQKQLGDFRENLGAGAVKGVMFTGRRTKKFIQEAEEQLGVRTP